MKLNILIGLLIATGSSVTFGGTLSISGDSEFIAVGKPSALKIHGQSNGGLSGILNLNNNTVEGHVKFKIDSLVTGVELRDRHMKEKYLEIKTFPDAQLTIEKVKLPSNPETDGFKSTDLPFIGQLTLHGVTHSITGSIDLSTSLGVTKGDGKFDLKLSDFKIDVPSYLGITVADTVTVKVHLKAKRVSGST
jgi:polyisoprenoid-binding protein YceI